MKHLEPNRSGMWMQKPKIDRTYRGGEARGGMEESKVAPEWERPWHQQ